MDRLPCELICMIFKFLNLVQLTRARLVSKKWKKIIDNEIRIKELSLNDFDDYFRESISSPELILNDYDLRFCLKAYEYNDSQMINNPLALISQKPMFSFLEYLNIQYAYDIKLLNKFNQLKKLNITNLSIPYDEVLSLKNLEILSILDYDLLSYSNSKLTLDTIKLHTFRLRCNLNRFDFKYPDSIELLDVDGLELTKNNYIFPKLKFLNYILPNYDRQFRFDLNKLTELQVINFINRIDWYVFLIAYEGKNLLKNLIQQKNLLRRKGLIINYNGIKIESESQLNSENFTGYIYLASPKDYPLFANDLFWIHQINYTDIRCLQDNNLATDSLSKFTNIHSIVAKQRILNPHDFISFISNYPNLRSLTLSKTRIKQEFINQLPTIFPSLTFLSIANSTKLNLNFLTEFEFLANLIVEHQLKLEIVLRLIKKLHLLNRINFRFQVNRFELKVCHGNYALSTRNHLLTYRTSNLLVISKVWYDRFIDMNGLLGIFKMLNPNLDDSHETPKKTRKRRSNSPNNELSKLFKSN